MRKLSTSEDHLKGPGEDIFQNLQIDLKMAALSVLPWPAEAFETLP